VIAAGRAVPVSSTGMSAAPTIEALARTYRALHAADRDAFRAAVASVRSGGASRVVVEEAMLQAVLFFGFPRVIQAFAWLDDAWSPPRDAERPEPVPVERHAAAGEAMFRGVYGRHADRVLANLQMHHPELRSFVVEAAYGRVLSRAGLDPKQRELLACAALAILDQERQLTSHALGALRFGAEGAEVLAVLDAVSAPRSVRSALAERFASDRRDADDAS
jgi:4-carboxymuconolactone decarboxylase